MGLLAALKLPPSPSAPTAPPDLPQKLEARGKALREANARIEKSLPALDERIKGLSGPARAAAEAQKQDLEKAQAAIGRQLKANDADLTALRSPATDRKAMNDILARAKEPMGTGQAVEVDHHDDAVEKKWRENKTTTTTTDYQDGKSTTRVDARSDKLGLGEATRTRTTATEEVTADRKKTDTTTTTTKVDKDGLAHTTERKTTDESKGQKVETTTKGTLKAGPGGVSVSGEHTEKRADGSSTTVGGSSKVERGDGKIGKASDSSVKHTGADGAETTVTGSRKGGLSADPDGALGAYGEGTKGVAHKTKNGVTAGAVGGLNAAISCNVQPKGSKYVVTLSVDLGASVSVSGGVDKSGEDTGMKPGLKGKGSGSVKVGAKVWMRNQWTMEESEAAGFIGALQGGGSAPSGTAHEIAVIRALLQKGPEAAQALHTGVAVGGSAEVAGMRAGDSRTLGASGTVGIGASVDGKVVGINASGEISREREMKVTKDEDGGATYDTKDGEKQKGEVGAKVSVGVAEGSASIGKAVTTSTGYRFRVKPDAKNAAQLQDAIAALAAAPQKVVEAFASQHANDPGLEITRIDVRDETDSVKVGAGVAGLKGTFAAGAGVEDTTTIGPDGRIDVRKRGHNEGGMGFEAGGIAIASGFEESAGGRHDAAGDRVVDVTRTDKGTDFVALGEKLVGRKPKEDKGVLATAAGTKPKEETDTTRITGLTLSQGDLKTLAAIAASNREWGKGTNDGALRLEWLKAADAIRKAKGEPVAVENALAAFTGGKPDRVDVIRRTLRGVGDTQSGSRWEFPNSLKAHQKDYQDLVIAACERQVAAACKKDGPDEAKKVGDQLLQQLQQLSNLIRSASDFENGSVQGEMLSAIGARQGKVEIEQRKAAGATADEAEKGQERADYVRLLDLCIVHQQEETELFGKIKAETGEDKDHMSQSAMKTVMDLTVQIKNLHSIWQKDYDRMAMLAQEQGWGKDHYAKFQPDKKRLDATVKSFKAGEASAPQQEKRDLTRATKASQERKYQQLQEIGKSDDQLFKDIKKGVEVTRLACIQLRDELKALLGTEPYPTVKLFYEQALPLFDRAETKVRQCGNSYDAMFDLGAAAWEEFKQCLALLRKAKGFVPKKKK